MNRAPRNLLFLSLSIIVIFGCKKERELVHKAKPEILINTQDPRLADNLIYLSSDTVYILAAHINRARNQSLIVEAGTLVKIRDQFTINIEAGAKFESVGTETQPVIFTSAAYQGGAGGGVSYQPHSWGGIAVNGNGVNGESSGAIQYTRIEFAGSGSMNGSLVLNDLSASTKLSHIQVSYSINNPSFRFNGGNVNASHLLSYASGNSDFYIGNGYTGMLQFLLGYRHPFFPKEIADFAGLKISGQGTFPLISNLSILGPGNQKGTSYRYADTLSYSLYYPEGQGNRVAALHTTGGAAFSIRNAVFSGFQKTGWLLDEREAALNVSSGESGCMFCVFHNEDPARVFILSPSLFPPLDSDDMYAHVMKEEFHNRIFSSMSDFLFTDFSSYDLSPKPFPSTGSPLLSGADFTGQFTNSFFEKVAFIGSNGDEAWLKGWTNFTPLQTIYNN